MAFKQAIDSAAMRRIVARGEKRVKQEITVHDVRLVGDQRGANGRLGKFGGEKLPAAGGRLCTRRRAPSILSLSFNIRARHTAPMLFCVLLPENENGKVMRTAATIGSGRTRKRLGEMLAVLLFVLAAGATADAQDVAGSPYLKSLSPAGAQSHLTDSSSLLRFALSNYTAEDMDARVLTFYAGTPGRQYGRDIWVPAQSTLWSWSCIGPPPSLPARNVVELKSLIYHRSAGAEHLVRSAEGQPLHSDLVRYRPREPSTTVMLDADIADGSQGPWSPVAEVRAQETRDLVRVFRHRCGLSEQINAVKQRFLPPVPEALDGIDHFVLGSNRIRDDIPGQRALREWLHRGGSLWVLLDLVEADTVATLLGDALELQVVDRISLTSIQVRSGPANPHRATAAPVEVEAPVEFARVVTTCPQVFYTVDGWPAAFLTEVGRGRVLFTTLGARGWMRPRSAGDPPPAYRDFPQLPVASVPFEFVAGELHPRPERALLPADALRSYVTNQIGYTVVRRDTTLFVFGLFLLALTGAVLALGRRGWLEHLGWLGPALALGAAGVFVALGEMSRNAVPPTVAVAQLVTAVPGVEEAQASGLLAVYLPALGTSAVGAEQGGEFDLDVAGLEGRNLRRVQTDVGCWHWENLELPAGVRLAPFRHTVRTGEPVEATIRFGPQGVEGRLAAGLFRQLEDVVLRTPGPQLLALRLATDGTFRAAQADEIPAGKFIAGGLWSDRQQARQALLEKLFAEPPPRSVADRSLLLAWAEPVDMHFNLAAPQARTTGSALLAIPLRFERTPADTRVVVPAAFVDCRRLSADGRFVPVAAELRLATTLRLRFQIPTSVRPLVVERARLTLKLHAPARQVVVGVFSGGEAVTVRQLASPLGAEQIEIDRADLLRLGDRGTLEISIAVGEALGGATEQREWRLESAGLEVEGRTVREGSEIAPRTPPSPLGAEGPGEKGQQRIAAPAYAVDEAIDSILARDPHVPAARVVKAFAPRLTSLWLQALERPENDLKCQAAAAIVLAQRRGMPGLQTTAAVLLRLLDLPEQQPTVRLAAAHALIVLDAREAADRLFAHVKKGGIDMRNLVEPALARWDYQPMRALWLERLTQPGLPGRGWLLALQGLAAAGESKAVPRLRELALSPATHPILRLDAARALGAIQWAGLENDAERLAASTALPGDAAHLAAASLLRKHRGEESAKILRRLAVGVDYAAAAIALDGLLDDDPRRIMPFLPQLFASPDASVRARGVEAHRRCPLPDHIALVAELLDDRHPHVRVSARKALVETAQKGGHGDAVRGHATRLLATARWRALEQATILLALLDHKPAAPRFVELLQNPRPEVFVAAAWGLRKLAVPATLPAQLTEIERRWQRSQKPDPNDIRPMIDRQVAQLAQSLGRAKYAPAAPLLARFIPKQWNIGAESRAAAIWALGLIYRKNPPAEFVDGLVGRLTDDSTVVPEDLGVRSMCAVALGRMKAEAAVDSLRKYYHGTLSAEPFPNACGWALEQITGEKLPTSGTVESAQRGWFLEPND